MNEYQQSRKNDRNSTESEGFKVFSTRKVFSTLLNISDEEVCFARRGFQEVSLLAREKLEKTGRVFLHGYHAALTDNGEAALAQRLNDTTEAEFRGFAFEGAAMGLSLLDAITPWNHHRWQSFLAGPSAHHAYIVHVGMGWTIARLPWLRWSISRVLDRFDPLLRWLVVDGYGFHEGYFHWPQTVERQEFPHHLTGYAARAFDQGLGRSLWFVKGADPEQIAATVQRFPSSRRADLWSGVGLASAYAGGVDQRTIELLKSVADRHQPHLAQGAAFAAKARDRSGNPASHTELACQVLCGMASDVAAKVTDQALELLPPVGDEPMYEVWRRRIRNYFAREAVLV